MDEVHSVVQHARMFEHKPDGQVTLINKRDGNGVPIVTMQDPLHYPFNTGFLMPGALRARQRLDLQQAAVRAAAGWLCAVDPSCRLRWAFHSTNGSRVAWYSGLRPACRCHCQPLRRSCAPVRGLQGTATS